MTYSPTTVLAAVLALAGIVPTVEAQITPELLSRASAQYERLDGMCADFEQRLVVPLLGTEVHSSGRLCSKRPAYFRMDFRDPDGDAVVADGEHLWVFFPSSQPGQVLRSQLGEGAEVDFAREFLSDPGVKYRATHEGTELVDGLRSHRFLLDPVVSGLGYTKARVWIDESQALVRRVEIHQENGSVRHLSLHDIDLAPGLTASDFRFVVPSGVLVVGVGEYSREG